MARAPQINKRLNAILQRLRTRPSTQKELITMLNKLDDNEKISQRTFARYIEAIRDQLGIDIIFDRSIRKYRVDNDENSQLNVEWLDALYLANLRRNAHELENIIFFEQRQMLGIKYIDVFFQAIKNKQKVSFYYTPHKGDGGYTRLVWPLALKEAVGRWYIIAINNENNIRSYGLDRMSNVATTTEEYEYPTDININEMFKNSFGIIADTDIHPIEIELTFSMHHGKYVKTYPIHHSQQIVSESDKELVVKLYIKPTYDFMQQLLWHGNRLIKVSPQHISDKLREFAYKG